MKLATFTTGGAEAGPLAGLLEDGRLRVFAKGPDAVRDVLAGRLNTNDDLGTYELDQVQLLAPIPVPQTIFAIGLNYADHIAEMGHDQPEWPTVFVKVNTAAAPPYGEIVCPDVVKRLDYEGEMAVVIGRDGRIGGYCVADDVTGRDLQKREPQWVRGKGADTFCPFGPWITTADEVPDPGNLWIKTWVNGELRQDSNTRNLVFGCDALVEFLSQTCSLRPGDLILTGTPGGVGQGMDPPRYLQSGDTVRIEVDALGAIEHRVR
ncbi:MAG TPA: fumarylacetoacetate hydrolase family protein [Solirubrobacteraceae bacterium]|nr:fumarylacetoacetate hydrolase family protein [Solirubrobacteraceae bacterium]